MITTKQPKPQRVLAAGMWEGLLETPFGWVRLAGTPAGLSQLVLPTRAIPTFQEAPNLPVVMQVRAFFERLSAGEIAGEDIPLDRGKLTPFQAAVYDRMQAIPPGEVLTYGQLANEVGRPGAARAVGQVCARNRLPLLIPCHRVTGHGKSLGGFSAEGGIAVKERLLAWEKLVALKPTPMPCDLFA